MMASGRQRAHPRGVCGLGGKMWPQIETNDGNYEPVFDPRDGGRLS
jgi:hypothetical protein